MVRVPYPVALPRAFRQQRPVGSLAGAAKRKPDMARGVPRRTARIPQSQALDAPLPLFETDIR